MKRCKKCQLEKPLCQFKIRKDTGKYRGECNDCRKEYFQARYAANRERISEQKHAAYIKNPDVVKNRVSCWKKNNPKKVAENYHKHKNARNAKKRQRYRDDTDFRKADNERSREYRKNNREKRNANERARRAKDIGYRLRDNLRSRFRLAVKNNRENSGVVDLLGCSISSLKHHLEGNFQPGMSWDNYGEWHVDHILPLASFDMTDNNQICKAWHYTNLQPLWAKDNLRKGAKIITEEL